MIVSISHKVWLCLPSASVPICHYGIICFKHFYYFLSFTFFKANFLEIESCVSRLFCPSVLWHCRLGHVACESRPQLCVTGWDVKPYSLTHTLSACVFVSVGVEIISWTCGTCTWCAKFVVSCTISAASDFHLRPCWTPTQSPQTTHQTLPAFGLSPHIVLLLWLSLYLQNQT